MDDLRNFWDLILGAMFSIVMAVLGTLSRVGHEMQHGGTYTTRQVLWLLPMAVTFGVISEAVAEYLRAALQLQGWYLSGALAGGLGLLGPVYFTDLANVALNRFRGGKKPDEDPSSDKDRG